MYEWIADDGFGMDSKMHDSGLSESLYRTKCLLKPREQTQIRVHGLNRLLLCITMYLESMAVSFFKHNMSCISVLDVRFKSDFHD